MDLLGLTALSTIQKTLDLINKNHHIDLKNLDTHETEYNDFVLTTA